MKTLAIAATLLAALTATAHGQGYPEPPPPPGAESTVSGIVRDGFTVGLGFGVGRMSDGEDDASAAALSLRLGVAVTPRILIVADISAATAESDGVDFLHTLVGGEVVGFVHDRAYLVGGLGMQKITLSAGNEEYESDSELGFVIGGGYEVMQRNDFALSAELRGFGAEIEGFDFRSVTVGVAATWF